MSYIKFISYRIIEPQTISRLPEGWLMYDTQSLTLEVYYQTDMIESELNFSIDLQTYSSFPGWKTVLGKKNLKGADGRLVLTLESLPNVNTEDYDVYLEFENFSHKNRFRIYVEGQPALGDYQVYFTKELFPLDVTEFVIMDPARRVSTTRYTSNLPGDVKGLLVSVKMARSSFTNLNGVFRIKNKRGGPVLYEKQLNFPELETTFLIDKLPAGIEPPRNINSVNDYSASLVISDGQFSRTYTSVLRMEAPVPVGNIEITDFAINQYPVFEEKDNTGYANDWENLICTVRVKANNYDPLAETGPGSVKVFFYDNGKYIFSCESEIMWDEDGTGWAFPEAPDFPGGSYEGKKTVRVSVNHYNRVHEKVIDPVAFTYAFRPEKQIEFIKCAVLRGATESTTIGRDDRQLIVDYILNGTETPLPVTFAVILTRRSRNRHRVVTSFETKTVGYSRIVAKGTGMIKGRDIVDLPVTEPALFQDNQIGVYVLVSYKYDQLLYQDFYEVGELDVEGSHVMIDSDKSSRSRPKPQPKPQYPKERLSGSHWCAKFPTSVTTADLAAPFKKNIQNFITMLEKNGATVSINATKRPKERAYLMHYAFKIAKKQISPGKVPSHAGVNIVWDHPNAVKAAAEMVTTYDIVYAPALNSDHIIGWAIDMNISDLPAKLKFTHNNKEVVVDIGKKPAASNVKLWEVSSKYFDVAKLASDRPHWKHKR